jgi:hypothetical protein
MWILEKLVAYIEGESKYREESSTPEFDTFGVAGVGF